MRRIILFICLLLLTSCASWWQDHQDTILSKGSGALGKLLSGDSAGALGQTMDLVLILLGLKGAQKGGQLVKRHVLNPRKENSNDPS